MRMHALASTFWSVLLLSPVIAAQEPPNRPASPPTEAAEIIVVPVHHANAHAVVKALQDLHVPIAVSAASDTTLIMRGSRGELNRITTDVLHLIDSPDVSAREPTATQFIAVNPEIRKAFLSLVGTVTSSPSTRVAIDESTGLLAVQATDRDVAVIRELIAKLDRPRKGMALTFYFLKGKIGESEASAPIALPKDLAPIADTLKALGLTQLSTMAPMMVRVDEDQKFESYSVNQTSGQAPRETLSYHVSGKALSKTGTNVVQVLISAEMSGRVGDPDKEKKNVGFEINTTIATRLGDYVLLSAGPSSTAGGDAVALVLRVTGD